MYTRSTTVKNRTGLHARPASDFVNTAKNFSSKINLWRPEEVDDVANAKSIIMLLSLGFGQGETVVISAEGEDENQAVDTLIELIESGFGEV